MHFHSRDRDVIHFLIHRMVDHRLDTLVADDAAAETNLCQVGTRYLGIHRMRCLFRVREITAFNLKQELQEAKDKYELFVSLIVVCMIFGPPHVSDTICRVFEYHLCYTCIATFKLYVVFRSEGLDG